VSSFELLMSNSPVSSTKRVLGLTSQPASIEAVAIVVFESEARLRLRGRDETGWPVLACALGLACDIRTGMPISWTSIAAGPQIASRSSSRDKQRQWILRSVYRLWPTVIVVVFAQVLEPRLDRLGSCHWRRVPDPGCKFRDTPRPLIEGGPERPRQSVELGMRALLCLAAVGVVPDAGKVDDPESRDRQTLQGNDAIGLAVGQDVDILMRAKDSDNAPLLLLDFCSSLGGTFESQR
jgi:hypothetical protein